jgi:hypothetical protein
MSKRTTFAVHGFSRDGRGFRLQRPAAAPYREEINRPPGADHMGLLWLLNGGTVIELHRHRSIIETPGSARQSYRRGPFEVGRVTLVWELAG